MSVSPNAISPESMRPIAPGPSAQAAMWQLMGRGVRSLVMLATVAVTGVVLVAFGATALG